MKTRLGRQETQFLAYAQMKNLRVVQTGEVRRALGLTQIQERELFRRLLRGRMIARVRRALFLVPPRLPLGGAWTPTEIQALNALMKDKNGSYQICGPTMFNRYGYDEQIPNRVYAYNNRISGTRKIGSIQLSLIKVADERLGGTIEETTSTGDVAIYSTRERTLLDAVNDAARFGTLPRAYEWIRRDLRARKIDAAAFVKMVLRFGDKGTRRRIAYLLERESCEPKLLRSLERSLGTSGSLIPWIPGLPKRGSVVRRWGLINNERPE